MGVLYINSSRSCEFGENRCIDCQLCLGAYLFSYPYFTHPWAGQLSRYSEWLRAGRSGIDSRWGRDFPPVQTLPGAHPASCIMGTGSFPGVKCVRGVPLTTHPLLVLRSWKSRAVLLPTLWATPGRNGITVPFTLHIHCPIWVSFGIKYPNIMLLCSWVSWKSVM